jgi:hypothetical protein
VKEPECAATKHIIVAARVEHLFGIKVEIEPLTEAQNVDLTWYIGLDAQGTQIGEGLWKGEDRWAACSLKSRRPILHCRREHRGHTTRRPITEVPWLHAR